MEEDQQWVPSSSVPAYQQQSPADQQENPVDQQESLVVQQESPAENVEGQYVEGQ